jgi:hypothetical protein
MQMDPALAELDLAYAVFEKGEIPQIFGIGEISDGSDLFNHENRYGFQQINSNSSKRHHDP